MSQCSLKEEAFAATASNPCRLQLSMPEVSYRVTPLVAGYEDLQLIAQGGFGRVFRAYQPLLDRVVAIKVLLGVTSSEERSRFEREVRAAGVLGDHPNIITIFDTGYTAEERPYFAMEYF